MPPTPPPAHVGSTGARFGRSARPDAPAVTAADTFLRRQPEVAGALRDALAAAEQTSDRARRRAAEVETGNQTLRRNATTGTGEPGSGVRAGRLPRPAGTAALREETRSEVGRLAGLRAVAAS